MGQSEFRRAWLGTVRHCSSVLPYAHLKLRLVHGVCGPLPAFWSGRLRAKLYRAAGFDVDESASIWGNVELTSGLPDFYEKLRVGKTTVISTGVTINLDERVSIGDNVTIGPHVLIYSGSHQGGPPEQRCHPGVAGKPVTIGDGCWVRVGAIILPGVSIGGGSVIAAGAVVSRDVPANSYVEGNPARVVKELPPRVRGSAEAEPPLADAAD